MTKEIAQIIVNGVTVTVFMFVVGWIITAILKFLEKAIND